MKKNEYKSKCKINKIGVTGDTLTGRGKYAIASSRTEIQRTVAIDIKKSES